jgi:hypothetical protein
MKLSNMLVTLAAALAVVALADARVLLEEEAAPAGAYTRPLLSST